MSCIYLCFPHVRPTALASALFLPVAGLLEYFRCISRVPEIIPFLYILERVRKSSQHKDSLSNRSDVLYMPAAKHLGLDCPKSMRLLVSDLQTDRYWVNKIQIYPAFVIQKLLADEN